LALQEQDWKPNQDFLLKTQIFCFNHCREPKEKSNGRHLSPIGNSTLDDKPSTESFIGSSPDDSKEEERVREKTQAQEQNEEQKHKEIQSDKREEDVKSEQQPAEDKQAVKERSSPKQQREDLKRSNSDSQPWEPAEKKIRVEYEPPYSKNSKVRVKEEKRDDQDHGASTHQKVLEKHGWVPEPLL